MREYEFKDQPITFLYLHLDYIEDERYVIMRAPRFIDIVDSYEKANIVGRNVIPYFRDSGGAYCVTMWENVNDEHVKSMAMELGFFGREAKDSE